jgi:hypothetical protein
MTVMGIKSAPNISHLLAEYLGNDLSRIANELNKLKIVLKDGAVLDGKIIEEHIGISKDFNIFELQKALATKDHAKLSALLIIWERIKNQIPFKWLSEHFTISFPILLFITLCRDNLRRPLLQQWVLILMRLKIIRRQRDFIR